MRFVQGATLGSYEIVSLLGAGGMGEVYRARDKRLGRAVAIKVLPEEMSRDVERVARFEREARSLAALNHPNVATLHGFESDGDRRFLVMELVEGEDLAGRIERGPIPVEEAIPLFLQIAEGLEAAHERGILHRDLKPANVKLGHDGRVKILDFGLAKALVDEHSSARAAGSLGDLTHSPTLTAQATRAGTLLGTAAYMSPEQARGLPADPRADVWAFGCCFYEALTGKRPFAGEDAPQTLASVLKDTPDWSALPADLPHHLAVLVRRCLEKNRRARLQSAGDLRIELQESLAPPTVLASTATLEHSGPRERRGSSLRLAWLLGSVAATLLAAGLVYLLVSKPDARRLDSPVTHVPVALPEGGRIAYIFLAPLLAISTDGRRIAYGLEPLRSLWVQDLDRPGEARPVLGTSGGFGPFFSPDGTSLGYLGSDGVKVVSLSGGDPRSVGEGGGWRTDGGAIWVDDWVYYVDGTGGISRAAASGTGAAQSITRPDPDLRYRYPQPLPGGERILHSAFRRGALLSDVAVTDTSSGEQTMLFKGAFAPRYLPTGHLLVAQEDVLLGMTLDLDTLKVGPAVPVLEGLVTSADVGVAAYAVSDSGTLVYLTGALEREGWLVRLTPGSEPERLNARPTNFAYGGLAVSPDGRQVALSRTDGDLWIFDLDSRELETRVTTDPARDWYPIWGPDDRTLAFVSTRGGGVGVYSRRADGLGPETLLIEDRRAVKWPSSWSPDGKTLFFHQIDPETLGDLWVVPAGQPAAAEVFLRTEFDEVWPAISPDAKWVAYASTESGAHEIYVISYPDKNIKRKISRGGGLLPKWSSDGKRIFFGSGPRVMVVDALDAQWTPSPPKLFVTGVDASGGSKWGLTPDEKSVIALERRPAPRLHMVENWFAKLKRLVPAN
jgi:serine/threonine protein kinase/Tol biopolymer transport system component